MVDSTFTIHTADFDPIEARGVVSDPYTLTRGESVSLNFNFPNIDGQTTGTITGIAGWERLQRHTDFAGTFSVNETLTGKPTYNERLPSSADVTSLVVGIEPSTDLQNNNVTGIWGIVESGSDNRNNPLTRYNFEISVTMLAEYGEFTRSELKTELERTL